LKLIARGAEAELYLAEWGGLRVVVKRRVAKPYRHRSLDEWLRRKRTITEARMLVRSLELGLDVPVLYEASVRDATLVMEFFDGRPLRWLIEERGVDGLVASATRRLGYMIGVLHEHGFVHGDVTTSNLLVSRDGRVKLIDFGLAGAAEDEEDMAVDVHLYLRAVESTHPEWAETLYKLFLEGYAEARGRDAVDRISALVKKLRLMGRYVEERRRRTVWGELHSAS